MTTVLDAYLAALEARARDIRQREMDNAAAAEAVKADVIEQNIRALRALKMESVDAS